MEHELWLVLGGIALYWFGVVWLRRSGLLPDYVGTQGPILTVHTGRFRSLLDRIARPKRAWRAWGNLGLGVALVVMAGAFVFFLFAAYATARNPGPATAVNQPRNVLVIPGVNQFLPLSAAPEIVLGLLVGLVVHEGGHGVMCRVGDIEVESVGLALLAVVPIGAFVEPDDDSRRRADRGAQSRMFAAGVMNNFAVTVLAFWLLFGPVAGSIGVASGAAVGGVLPGSAAETAGIERGDLIVGVEDRAIESNADLESTLSSLDAREVRVRIDEGEAVTETTVTRSLLVTEITAGTPFAGAIGVDPRDPTRIVAVNGTTVHTEAGLRAVLAERRVVSLRTDGGDVATGPAGAAVRVRAEGPVASAGFPAGRSIVITAIGGERVVSATDLGRVLDETKPGETVAVEYFVGGERRSGEVELGAHPEDGNGFLGVDVAPGVSGMTVSDFGVRPYPAEQYLALMDGSRGGSFVGRIVIALQLPLAGLTEVLPFNFAGFTGGVQNFYVPTGALSFLGGGVFLLANSLFWIGWINLNLGVFNCIPAFPLDGGHILRASTEAVVSRLPVRRRRDLTTAVTTSVGLAMLVALILTLFGPQLLAG